jgi:hypothetical protein
MGSSEPSLKMSSPKPIGAGWTGAKSTSKLAVARSKKSQNNGVICIKVILPSILFLITPQTVGSL